ncbi:MAG: sigma-54 dependent transcriptional regulator, partial [Planctomycetota bacterium]
VPDKLEGFASGANQYCLKPLERRELLAQVDVLLRLKEALAETRRCNEDLHLLVEDRTRALKEAMQGLEEQRALLANMLNHIPAIVVVADEEQRLVAANAEASRIFGQMERGMPLGQGELAPLLEPRIWVEENKAVGWLMTRTMGSRRFEAQRMMLDDPPRLHLYLFDVTEREELLEQVRLREFHDLREELDILKDELTGRYRMSQVITSSPAMAHVTDTVRRVRNSKASILIRGESGTGKELIARAIHHDGALGRHPFVAVNCASIPRDLAESELFGHVRGAFTGAENSSPGLFVQADGGTLFLDEVGACSLEVQKKLLRVVESGRVRPVGSSDERRVSTRLIAASNRDLMEMVARGEFREDLFYRLAVVMIEIPPLRERGEDIIALASHFLQKHAVISGRQEDFQGISKEAMRILESYPWPGNVRELENVFAGAMSFAPGPTLRGDDLPAHIQLHASMPGASWTLRTDQPLALGRGSPRLPPDVRARDSTRLTRLSRGKGDAERRMIVAALRHADGDKKEAAKLLEIGKSSIYRKINKFRIAREEWS